MAYFSTPSLPAVSMAGNYGNFGPKTKGSPVIRASLHAASVVRISPSFSHVSPRSLNRLTRNLVKNGGQGCRMGNSSTPKEEEEKKNATEWDGSIKSNTRLDHKFPENIVCLNSSFVLYLFPQIGSPAPAHPLHLL